MTLDLPTNELPTFLTTLTEAANAYRHKAGRPSASLVVSALLEAEKVAKQQRLTYPFAALVGRWRLCFATGTRKVRKRGGIVLGKGWYMPPMVPAHITFNIQVPTSNQSSSRGDISNQIQLGYLVFNLTGPTQYLGKKNLLAFDFTQMQLSLFGRTLYSGNFRGGNQSQDFYNKSIAKLPFFAFFLITEDFIAARGRGGGLALWIKD